MNDLLIGASAICCWEIGKFLHKYNTRTTLLMLNDGRVVGKVCISNTEQELILKFVEDGYILTKNILAYTDLYKLVRGKKMKKKTEVRKGKDGKFSDKENLSKEKHELVYAKKVAKEVLASIEGKSIYTTIQIRVSKLRRLCDYVIQE